MNKTNDFNTFIQHRSHTCKILFSYRTVTTGDKIEIKRIASYAETYISFIISNNKTIASKYKSGSKLSKVQSIVRMII